LTTASTGILASRGIRENSESLWLNSCEFGFGVVASFNFLSMSPWRPAKRARAWPA
jgi:hypothetical protein